MKDDLILITFFPSPTLAQIARTFLEENGTQTFVDDADPMRIALYTNKKDVDNAVLRLLELRPQLGEEPEKTDLILLKAFPNLPQLSGVRKRLEDEHIMTVVDTSSPRYYCLLVFRLQHNAAKTVLRWIEEDAA